MMKTTVALRSVLLFAGTLAHLGQCSEQSVLKAEAPVERLQSCTEAVSLRSDDAYASEASRFWSVQQSQTRPACVFRPQTSQEVAAAIEVIRANNCAFAVKSGGHAAFAGASNIENGLTLDLGALNEISVAADLKTVYVGPGNRWYDVYKYLEKEDLVVIGGRVGGVGVGGLTLGGGISFFSNEYGWALDNVASYEVVLATGEIVTASPASNQDLYWALRGGGSNFGIVTRFELNAYPLESGLMWGGQLGFPGNQNRSLIAAFDDYVRHGAIMDAKSSLVLAIYYLQQKDSFMCGTHLEYTLPLKEGAEPAVFSDFLAEPNRLRDTLQTTTLSEISLAFNRSSPDGLRQSYWGATFALDAHLMEDLLKLWTEAISPIKRDIDGYIPVFMLQLVSVPMLTLMSKNGGNCLGLDDEEPLVIINVSAMWKNAEDDGKVISAYEEWLDQAHKLAKKRGLWHDYVYMNYASFLQNPIQSYGQRNVRRLKQIATTYDPEGIFQKLQPGYFKL